MPLPALGIVLAVPIFAITVAAVAIIAFLVTRSALRQRRTGSAGPRPSTEETEPPIPELVIPRRHDH